MPSNGVAPPVETIEARWLDSPPADWDAWLRNDPSGAPGHRPEVARAMAAALPGMTAAWVAVGPEHDAAGGACVLIERRAGFHWLHAMPFLLGGAPLARPGEHARVDLAVAAALEARARSLGAVGGEWVLYRPGGPSPADEALERVGGETRWMESAIVDLGSGIEAAWRRVEGETRRSIEKARKHGLVFAEAPDEVEEGYRLYAAQARAFAGYRPRPLAFWRRLLEPSASRPEAASQPEAAPPAKAGPAARLFVVRDERGVLATALTLVGGREAMVWLTGMDPSGRAVHAFPLLLWSLVEWGAGAGCVRVNLGASAGRDAVATFKRGLGAADYRHPVRWMGAGHAGALGRGLAALQRRLRRGRPRGAPA